MIGDSRRTTSPRSSRPRALWELKGVDAGTVNGDIVVGTDYDVAENSSMVQATGLDLTTGRQLWSSAHRSYGVNVITSDVGLVR